MSKEQKDKLLKMLNDAIISVAALETSDKQTKETRIKIKELKHLIKEILKEIK